MSLAALGGVYALLRAGHDIGDYWIQTNDQAKLKGEAGERGQRACAAHVASLIATQAVFVAAGCLVTGQRLKPSRVALGLTFNAITHYAIDRREHGVLPKLVDRFPKLGKRAFYELGDYKVAPCGTGAHALDQTCHHGSDIIAAAVMTSGRAA